MRLRDRLTRLRPGTTVGPDGATVAGDWSSATETDYPCEFQPLGSTEEVVGQQRTESTHRAFLPATADVVPTDRLRFLGLVYQVDGQPEHWRRGGRTHHLEVFCFRIQGG